MGLLPVGINNRIVQWRAKEQKVDVFVNDSSGILSNIEEWNAYFYAKKYPIRSTANLDISVGYTIRNSNGFFTFDLYPYLTDISIGDYIYEIILDNTYEGKITIAQDRFTILPSLNTDINYNNVYQQFEFDSSLAGNYNNLLYFNEMTYNYSPGLFNQAVDVSQGLRMIRNVPSNNFIKSLNTWFKITNYTPNTERKIILNGLFVLSKKDSSTHFVNLPPNSLSQWINLDISLNTWFNLTILNQNPGIKVYLDRDLIFNNSIDFSENDYFDLCLGSYITPGWGIDGSILFDRTRMYRRLLTIEDIDLICKEGGK